MAEDSPAAGTAKEAMRASLGSPEAGMTSEAAADAPTAKKQRREVQTVTLKAVGGRGLSSRIECLSSHTLMDLAEVLCSDVMPDMRQQADDCGLHAHLWWFTVGGTKHVCDTWFDDDGISAASTSLASLGLSTGSRLRFEYDMGDTTTVSLLVEGVGAPGAEGSALRMPRVVSDASPSAAEQARPSAGAMDQAFPALSAYLLKGHGDLDIGRGCDAHGFWWGVIHNRGDGLTCRSLEATHAFSDMEEALLCFDRALAERARSGEKDEWNLLKCAQVYPSGKHMKPIGPTMTFTIDVFSLSSGGARREHPPADFNFQLPRDWRGSKPAFSFSSAFPKINAKLLQRSGVCWWFSIVRGRMLAFKGKAKKYGEKEPYATTGKHSTLHGMLAEMEGMIK